MFYETPPTSVTFATLACRAYHALFGTIMWLASYLDSMHTARLADVGQTNILFGRYWPDETLTTCQSLASTLEVTLG